MQEYDSTDRWCVASDSSWTVSTNAAQDYIVDVAIDHDTNFSSSKH